MKITYIVNTFPKLSETFVLNQITGLIDRGHEVDIISLVKLNEGKVHDDVLKYNLLSKTHFVTRNSSSLGFEVTEPLISSLIFTDIIHAHFAAEPTNAALNISRAFNIPYVFTAHAYDIFINPDFVKLRERCDLSTRVITVSDFNKSYLLKSLGNDLENKIDIIRYGIDTDRFRYVTRTAADRVPILLIGRFVEKKGITYAIDGFAELHRKHPNTELRIIGDGPLNDEIVAKISSHNLGDHIILLGAQPQDVVLQEMNNAAIMLLPSVRAANGDSEGVPVSLMEAMATGLPVVATLHTGIPELVTDGVNGFLIPERDSHAIADRLSKLVSNPALRLEMGQNGRKVITTVYEHRIEMQHLERLFNGLMEGRTSISKMQKSQRALLAQRIRDIAAALIGVRADQLRNIEQSIARYDDRLKKVDEAVKLLGDLKQKDELIRQRDQSIVQKDQLIAQKDNLLHQKDDHIRQRDQLIAQKDQQVVQKEQLLSQKNQELIQKDGQLRQKDEYLKDKDLQISRFGTESKEKEQQIHEYRERLKQANSDLKNAVNTLSHSKTRLDEQSGQLQNLNEYVDNLAVISKNNEAKILELQQTVSGKDQLIRLKDENLQQRDNKIKLLDADIKRKNDELVILRKWLGDITSSFPYKIFKKFLAPIRDLLKKKSDVNYRQSPSALPPSGKRDEIVYLPDWSSANPYQKMLYAAVEKSGTTCRGMQGKDFTFGWLWKNRHRVQIIHLHWLFGIYDPATTGITTLKVARFVGKILLARLLSYRLFWTVHNFISHEATSPKLETLVRKFVAYYSEILIVHCNYAKDLVCTHWKVPDEKVHVKPMGSYVGFYKNNVSREEARKKLGIPTNAFVFLFFGMVRKYKGIPNLVQAFKELKQSHPNMRLIIAGIPHNSNTTQEIEALSNDPDILLHIYHVPDDEVQFFFNACDLVVLPFINILSTSSALLAFTFNKATILPRKGCIPELVSDGVGYLYNNDDELKETMLRALKDVSTHHGNNAPRQLAERLEWNHIVRDTYLPAINRKPERKTLLIITNYLPQFDRAAGCFRLFNIIKGLVPHYNVIMYAEWFHKHYVAGNDKYSKALQDLGVEVILPFEGEAQTKKKLREILTTRQLHSVVIEFFHIANINIDMIRQLRPDLPVIIDSVDVRFHRLEMMADVQKSEEVRRTAIETKEQELLAYSKSDSVWAITPYDRDVIHKYIPDTHIDIVPMLHPIPDTIVERASRKKNTLLFVGGFNHPPNADAVLYFCKEVLPLVKKRIPDIKFTIVGDSPPPEVQALKSKRVEVAGFVPELKPYLDSSYLSVVPLRFGAGMKGKVGESLAHGLPVVTTSVGAQGIGLTHKTNIWIADTPQEFADGICKLLTDDRLYDNLVRHGRERMMDAFSAERGVQTVLDLLRTATTRFRAGATVHNV